MNLRFSWNDQRQIDHLYIIDDIEVFTHYELPKTKREEFFEEWFFYIEEFED